MSLHAVSRNKLESCVCAVMRKGRGVERGHAQALITTFFPTAISPCLLQASTHSSISDTGRAKQAWNLRMMPPLFMSLYWSRLGGGRDLGVRAVLGGGGGGSGYSSCRRHTLLEPCTAPRSACPQAHLPALTRAQATLQGILRVPILLCGGGGGPGASPAAARAAPAAGPPHLRQHASFATGSCGLVSCLLGCGQAVKQ